MGNMVTHVYVKFNYGRLCVDEAWGNLGKSDNNNSNNNNVCSAWGSSPGPIIMRADRQLMDSYINERAIERRSQLTDDPGVNGGVDVINRFMNLLHASLQVVDQWRQLVDALKYFPAAILLPIAMPEPAHPDLPAGQRSRYGHRQQHRRHL